MVREVELRDELQESALPGTLSAQDECDTGGRDLEIHIPEDGASPRIPVREAFVALDDRTSPRRLVIPELEEAGIGEGHTPDLHTPRRPRELRLDPGSIPWLLMTLELMVQLTQLSFLTLLRGHREQGVLVGEELTTPDQLQVQREFPSSFPVLRPSSHPLRLLVLRRTSPATTS